ncbi:MAG: GTPase Era [Reyranellaceae bacterium]
MSAAEQTATRCGFVALLGAPNVGKSTLLNALVGAKVAIVSPKPQTTRSRIAGIVMEGEAQIVLVDVPGIFQPRRRLDRAMVASAWQGAKDADAVLLVVDAQRPQDGETWAIVERLKAEGRRAILVLNKVDAVSRETLLPIAQRFNEHGDFPETFMVSALTGSGVADLRAALAAKLPPGPHLFPPDQLTDLPQRLLAAEITREQVYLQLHEEVPYSTAVETENWVEREDGSVRIDQAIYVQREGQKAIVLGKGGTRIKALGQAARRELEEILGRRVHLFLFVKVRENWIEDPERFSEWGLDYNA